MSKFAAVKEMTFKEGKAVFFAKAREGAIYPLGEQKRHMVDGELVGGGGTLAMFKDHIWITDSAEYAAGLITQTHFIDPRGGYSIHPSCLPKPVLALWPDLDMKAKRDVCLALVNGDDPELAVASVEQQARRNVVPTVEAPTLPPEPITCPVPGCGLVVDDQADPIAAKASILTHVRLMHPDWEG